MLQNVDSLCSWFSKIQETPHSFTVGLYAFPAVYGYVIPIDKISITMSTCGHYRNGRSLIYRLVTSMCYQVSKSDCDLKLMKCTYVKFPLDSQGRINMAVLRHDVLFLSQNNHAYNIFHILEITVYMCIIIYHKYNKWDVFIRILMFFLHYNSFWGRL